MKIRRKLHTHESATAMTRGKLKKAIERNLSDNSKIASAFIADGRGHERPSEYLIKDDALSQSARALSEEASNLSYAATRFTGPGREFLL